MAARRGTGTLEVPDLGSKVRLHEYPASELPAHPDLAPYQTSGDQPDLKSFIISTLSEGNSFVTSYIPAVIKVRTSQKTVPPSKATVQLAAHRISAARLPAEARTESGESWFVRSSLHKSEKAAGTADWEEFEEALLDNHSQHEMDYTPDVFDAYRVLSWDEELAKMGNIVGSWEKVEMGIFEMAHKIPPPLTNRVFSVLVVKAKNTAVTPNSFIIVQIPIEISRVQTALYANGRHKKEGDTMQKKKDITMGVYTSVERCELEDNGHVKWVMATASNAKGNLPMFVQKQAIPDAIAKDVALVIGWLDKRRNGKA
ncbi:hypothetical protein AAFC00_005159 [Neodothiora populina]|uniref:DUF3074 domain-containing protein n=1 Tax=Neodothiora populina TaxID=2781224 RepID=A0ABR3PK00_9PEZI